MTDSAKARTDERRSRSRETARQVERERIERMSPRERILLALRLGRRARMLESERRPTGDRS